MKELNDFALWIEESKQGIRKRNVKVLNQVPSLILAYKAVSGMQAAIYDHAPLTAVCSTIGKLVCQEFEAEEMTMGDKNVARVDVGYHLLHILFKQKKMKLREARRPREAHTVVVMDGDFIDSLMYSVNSSPMDLKLHSRPIYDAPLQYKKFSHPVLGDLVRKCNPNVRPFFTFQEAPMVYDVINKHMRTPYEVNSDVLDTIMACKEDDVYTQKSKTLEEDARIGIQREQTGVLDMAEAVGEKIFYQGMFYDFRGRLYSSMTYLSPQGSKLSKSLFYFAEKKPIGTQGWFWMLVHAANCWGEDKLSLDDGYDYANDRLDEWMSWASNPQVEKGWQDADDAYGFLAAILDMYKAQQLPDYRDFESGLMVAWDATCSGLQVLSALTRDKDSGKLCNLTGDTRGDYYQMIAEDVWGDCTYTEAEAVTARGIHFDLTRMSKFIENAANKTQRRKAIDEIQCFMEHNREDIRIATKVFWSKPEIKAQMRKIVKRPCMTYFYSCQPKTMSRQLFDDFKSEPEFKGLQMSYCYWICNRIYKACREKMPIATKVMDALIDMGVKDFKAGNDFTITAPYTKFKLMQYYRNPDIKRVKMKYLNKSIYLNVLVGRNERIKYNKVKSATSPNVVHMLDSQLVASIVMRAEYPINCIHDSFSTCPADAGLLYEDARTCFVDLFDEDLLRRILEEKDFECDIQLGDLDINDVLDNEYFVK